SWQLCGYGRSDWSTKLIRGLTSEAAAGFRSRRGPSHDSTLVTPHNAPFSTYKAPRVHHAARLAAAAMAARGARAAASNAGDRTAQQPFAPAVDTAAATCGSIISRAEPGRSEPIRFPRYVRLNPQRGSRTAQNQRSVPGD